MRIVLQSAEIDQFSTFFNSCFRTYCMVGNLLNLNRNVQKYYQLLQILRAIATVVSTYIYHLFSFESSNFSSDFQKECGLR